MEYRTNMEGELGKLMMEYARDFIVPGKKLYDDMNQCRQKFINLGYVNEDICTSIVMNLCNLKSSFYKGSYLLDNNAVTVKVRGTVDTGDVKSVVDWNEYGIPLVSPDYRKERNAKGYRIGHLIDVMNLKIIEDVDNKMLEKAKLEARQSAIYEEAKQKAADEMKAWVKDHGSERLKMGVEEGYCCMKMYTFERFRYEITEAIGDCNEYVLDYDEVVSAKDRSCPSLEALKEMRKLNAHGLEARILWLPNGLSELRKEGEYVIFEGCEAIEVKHPNMCGCMLRCF